MNKTTAYLVAGARPNFMKIAALWRAFQSKTSQVDQKLIHTGQHYDYQMSQVFFEQLDLPEPDYHLQVGPGTHGLLTGQVLIEFEKLILEHKPDVVIVVGDVNSTLAAALAAAKLNIPVAHVEAGLRSFDQTMPEEINRVLTDHISQWLFASEPIAETHLKNEGIDQDKIYLVGNVMIDSLLHFLPRIQKCDCTERFELKNKEYALVTFHRPVNVDSPSTLKQVLDIIQRSASKQTVVFPAHPRTVSRLEQFNYLDQLKKETNLKLISPLGYVDFLNLVMNAQYVITDSGGIQQETTWLGIPCLTYRETTELPITIEHGTNRLLKKNDCHINHMLDWARSFNQSDYQPPALWDGKAAERIADILF